MLGTFGSPEALNPAAWPSGLVYLVVFVAAAVEGEVVFVTASALVKMGYLDPAGVLIAGALGGSAGDQFYFYAFRGRLRHWLNRLKRVKQLQQQVEERVRRRAIPMMLACRFLPGLRIAIGAACAYAKVPARQFTACSLLSGFVWAAGIMIAVAYAGPEFFSQLGINSRWTPLIPASLVVAFLYWLGRAASPHNGK
jgi:membrane protein DedA with SNARE-associated domain